MVEQQEKIGDWLYRRIGGNHIVIFPHPTVYANSALPMTGAELPFYVAIPYFHRINKIVLLHLTSAFADGTDKLSAKFEVEQGNSDISPKWHDRILNLTSVMLSLVTENYGDGFEYEARNYTLKLNSTATDLVIPLIYIQKIAEGIR